MNGERYLIYKASGGLAHMLLSLAKALDLARLSNRILVVDTETHSAFRMPFSTFFYLEGVKYIDDLSTLPADLKFKQYDVDAIRTYGSTWTEVGYFFREINISKVDVESSEPVVMYASQDGVFPDDFPIRIVKSELEKIEQEAKVPRQFIAVHYRNTDRRNDVDYFVTEAKRYCKKKSADKIFLATDDFHALDNFKRLLPGLDVFQLTSPGDFHGKNIHYSEPNKYQMVFESLLDMYVILRSKYFIPSRNSGYSKLIINMIRNDTNMFRVSTRTVVAHDPEPTITKILKFFLAKARTSIWNS